MKKVNTESLVEIPRESPKGTYAGSGNKFLRRWEEYPTQPTSTNGTRSMSKFYAFLQARHSIPITPIVPNGSSTMSFRELVWHAIKMARRLLSQEMPFFTNREKPTKPSTLGTKTLSSTSSPPIPWENPVTVPIVTSGWCAHAIADLLDPKPWTTTTSRGVIDCHAIESTGWPSCSVKW